MFLRTPYKWIRKRVCVRVCVCGSLGANTRREGRYCLPWQGQGTAGLFANQHHCIVFTERACQTTTREAQPKIERLVAALKAAMRDEGRSRNRSQNGIQFAPETTPQWPKKKSKQNLTRGQLSELHPRATTNEWQCADCGQTNWMTRKERRQCHKQPPGLDAVQGGGIRVHGEPSTDVGGRSQTQNGQSAQKVSTPGGQGPAHLGDPPLHQSGTYRTGGESRAAWWSGAQ